MKLPVDAQDGLSTTEFVRADPDCNAFKFLEAHVGKSVDPNATIDCVAYMTTDRVDSDNEVVLPSGADLSRFEKNKVLMVCHALRQPGCYYLFPVGRVVQTKVRPHGILASIVFARTSAMGREVKGLFDEDMLRSFSIGFQSIESSTMTWDEAHSRADSREAYERAGGRILVHRQWKLLELSIAPIPCNEDALVVKYKSLGRPVPTWLQQQYPVSEVAMPENTAMTFFGTRTEEASEEHSAHSPVVAKEADAEDGGSPEVTDGMHCAVQSDCGEDETHAEIGEARAVPCKSPVLIDGTQGLKDLAEGSGTTGGDTADTSAEDDRHATLPIRAHDHVRIDAPHHKGVGMVKSIHCDGMVPDVAEDVRGTVNEPAARVRCFKAMGSGHVPTREHVGVLCKHLERIDPLEPPTGRKTDAVNPTVSLPPLTSALSYDKAVKALVASSVPMIREAVTEAEERAMGYV